jgi:hypothetical protein
MENIVSGSRTSHGQPPLKALQYFKPRERLHRQSFHKREDQRCASVCLSYAKVQLADLFQTVLDRSGVVRIEPHNSHGMPIAAGRGQTGTKKPRKSTHAQ